MSVASAVSLALLGCGLWLLGGQAYRVAKASVADVLIERAWRRSLADGKAHRPWGWADMEPLAKLHVPRLRVERTVLSGATGESMAFGLGHVHGTATPLQSGHCVVAGHRHTEMAFLSRIQVGDRIELTTPAGSRTYQVRTLSIVAADSVEGVSWSGAEGLSLVTCYPFAGLLETQARFVAHCEPVTPASPEAMDVPVATVRSRRPSTTWFSVGS